MQHAGWFLLHISGHGRSDGLRAFIPDFSAVVDDFDDWAFIVKSGMASSINDSDGGATSSPRDHLPLFVYAESMGGAIALQVRMRVYLSCYVSFTRTLLNKCSFYRFSVGSSTTP